MFTSRHSVTSQKNNLQQNYCNKFNFRKLTFAQLFMNFPTFCVSRIFINVFYEFSIGPYSISDFFLTFSPCLTFKVI
jgi:hypothetical protein